MLGPRIEAVGRLRTDDQKLRIVQDRPTYAWTGPPLRQLGAFLAPRTAQGRSGLSSGARRRMCQGGWRSGATTRGELDVLQIVTKLYFREGVPLHSTVHREVLYTNCGFLRSGVVDLPVGKLAPSTGMMPVSPVTLSVTEPLEAEDPDGARSMLVATSGTALVDALADVLSFGINAVFSRDRDLVKRLVPDSLDGSRQSAAFRLRFRIGGHPAFLLDPPSHQSQATGRRAVAQVFSDDRRSVALPVCIPRRLARCDRLRTDGDGPMGRSSIDLWRSTPADPRDERRPSPTDQSIEIGVECHFAPATQAGAADKSARLAQPLVRHGRCWGSSAHRDRDHGRLCPAMRGRQPGGGPGGARTHIRCARESSSTLLSSARRVLTELDTREN